MELPNLKFGGFAIIIPEIFPSRQIDTSNLFWQPQRQFELLFLGNSSADRQMVYFEFHYSSFLGVFQN